MLSMEQEARLVGDREDLVTVLQMRFGTVPGDMIQAIYEISDFHLLQRLILAAANAADWQTFIQELDEGHHAVRLVGDSYDPLRHELKEGGNACG